MSSFNYLTGVAKRPLPIRVFSRAITALAILGWVFLFVIIITIVTNTFDELIIMLWEI